MLNEKMVLVPVNLCSKPTKVGTLADLHLFIALIHTMNRRRFVCLFVYLLVCPVHSCRAGWSESLKSCTQGSSMIRKREWYSFFKRTQNLKIQNIYVWKIAKRQKWQRQVLQISNVFFYNPVPLKPYPEFALSLDQTRSNIWGKKFNFF